MFCRNWLAQLERHHPKFAANGVQVVAVGLGQPKHAAHFGGRLAPGLTALTYPTPEAHAAFGVGHATLAALSNPAMARAALGALAGGHFQGKATGDARVLSATFVIEDGVVRYSHYARFPGDDPDIDTLLAAAEAARTETPA